MHIVDDVALDGRLAQTFQPPNWRPVLSQKNVVSPMAAATAGIALSRPDPCWQTNCASAVHYGDFDMGGLYNEATAMASEAGCASTRPSISRHILHGFICSHTSQVRLTIAASTACLSCGTTHRSR